MTILVTVIVLILLFILDAWTTAVLAKSVNGEELNPFVDTTDFSSILLSPMNFVVFSVVLFCLLYAEKNRSNVKEFFEKQSIRLTAYFFPIYFLFTKSFAIINNIFPFFGYSTPIHYLRMPFRSITENPFMQLILVNTISAIVLMPAIIFIAKFLYGERNKNERNTNHSARDVGHT